MKKCPFCNELIEENLSVCPICGEDLPIEKSQKEFAQKTSSKKKIKKILFYMRGL